MACPEDILFNRPHCTFNPFISAILLLCCALTLTYICPQITHKHFERRLLVAECCGVLAPYIPVSIYCTGSGPFVQLDVVLY